MKQDGYLKTLELRTPVSDLDSVFRLTVYNITTGEGNVIDNLILNSDDYTIIETGSFLTRNTDQLQIDFESYNSSKTDNVRGGWNSLLGISVPALAQFTIDDLLIPTSLKYDHTDLDGLSRATELNGIVANSLLLISESDDPTRSVEVKILTTTAETGFTTYTCELIGLGAKGTIRSGKTCVSNFDIPITQPTQYNVISNLYSSQPDFADVSTKLFFDGVDQSALNTDCYGIRLSFQRAYFSPDWFLKQLSGSGTSGSGNTIQHFTAKNIVTGSGGDILQGAWRFYELNDLLTNIPGVTLVAGQLTLTAGQYINVQALCVAYVSDFFQVKFKSISGVLGLEFLGHSAGSDYNPQQSMTPPSSFYIDKDTVFEVQYYCERDRYTDGKAPNLTWGNNINCYLTGLKIS